MPREMRRLRIACLISQSMERQVLCFGLLIFASLRVSSFQYVYSTSISKIAYHLVATAFDIFVTVHLKL